MSENQESLKKCAQIALAAMGVLLIGAFVFYKERVLFTDGSFLIFNIINNKAMDLARTGSFVSQIFPYIGERLHLSLKTELILYSISFNLFYLIAALVTYLLREYRLVVLMGLFYFLFFTDSYFWVSEVPQAIAWMFIFLSSTLYLGRKKQNIFIIAVQFLLLAYLTVSTHYMALPPTIFLWVYLIIEKDNWPFSKNETALLTLLLVGIVIFRFTGTQVNAQMHLHNVTHFSLKDILASFATPVVEVFLYRCLVIYWMATILFIIGIVYLLKNKQITLAIWTIALTLGYLVAMGLTYCDLDRNISLFHIESEWQPIAIIIATPFVLSFLPNTRSVFAKSFLIIIFITGLASIGCSVSGFSWRTHFKEQVLAQMRRKNISKLALYNNNDLMTRSIQVWATPFESLLVSSADGDKPQLSFFFLNKDDKNTFDLITHSNGFYSAFGMLPNSALNHQYFCIDSTHPYQIMTYEELMK